MKNPLSFALIFVFALNSFGGQSRKIVESQSPEAAVKVLSVIETGIADYRQTANKPTIILKKPQPENRGTNCKTVSAEAVLKVTFDKSAKITAAEIAKSSGCTEFDNSAVSAAFGIEFEPAIKDGEAISATKMLSYKYKRY